MSNQESIQKILQGFQKFQIVKCNMHHEQVALDLNKKSVYREENNIIIFNRVKLCAAKNRAVRLGCAHASSNINFTNLLNDLEKLLPEKSYEISSLKNEFKDIVNKIYQLDHKKGQLEHDISLSKIASDYSKIDVLKFLSSKIKREHNLFMDNLVSIKENVESLIKNHLMK